MTTTHTEALSMTVSRLVFLLALVLAVAYAVTL
jgi:flagellar biogenesis protein FliO